VLVEVAIVFVAAFVVVSGVTALRRGRQPRLSMGAWLLHYARTVHGRGVARETPEGHVIEKHVVALIPDSDQDWSRKFVEAKLEAEERAFHLNADRSPRQVGGRSQPG
jgi:hypothetical protein